MSEPEQAVDTRPAALLDLGAACIAVYLSTAPVDELYQRAVQAAARRARSLLQGYLIAGSTTLRKPIAADDRSLFALYAADCLRLAHMAQGHLVLSPEQLAEIIQRP